MALTDDLIFYYKCEENAANTTVNDASSNIDATSSVNTSTLSSEGKLNNGFSFTSSSSHGILTNSNCGISGSGNRSVSVWAYPTASNVNQCIVGMGTYSTSNLFDVFILGGTGKWFLNVFGANDFDPDASVSTNQWTHIVATYDGDAIRMYINGTKYTQAGGKTLNTTNSKVGIARRAGNDALSYFNGKIDCVGLWSRVLSDTEAASLYNSGDGVEYPFSGGGGDPDPDSTFIPRIMMF